MRLSIALSVLLFAACAGAQLLNLVTIKGDQLPYLQTFDSWDVCNNVGTCYERRCDKLRSGFYNNRYERNPEYRHWWIIDRPTTSNWRNEQPPSNCNDVKTGPCYDHTQGAGGRGKFMFAEASGCFGVNFELITPTIQFTNSSARIELYYFMHGAHINNALLAIDYSLDNKTSFTPLASISGSQQSSSTSDWKILGGNVPSINPTESTPVEVVFRIRARTGSSYYSDVAIDDILISQDGEQLNVTTPWIDPNCTATDTCILPSTSSTGIPVVSGSSGGGGLSDDEIAGIVIGIVGGAIALCCCLIIIIIVVLLIISPKKPPEGGSDGL